MNTYHLLAYLALLTFITGMALRISQILKIPPQDRWKLYPMPYVWSRSRRNARSGKGELYPNRRITDVIGENLFLAGLREQNPSLWRGAFALHLGLYLLGIELALLILTAIMYPLRPGLAGTLGLPYILRGLAWAGYGLGIIGAVVVMRHRLSEQRLRLFSTAGHYFNLLVLGSIFSTGLIWAVFYSDYAHDLIATTAGLAEPALQPDLPQVGQWHVGLTLFLFFYFPFTHMTHAVLKYFIYRDVRLGLTRKSSSKLEARVTPRAYRETLSEPDPHFTANVNPHWPGAGTGNDHDKT